MVKTSQIQKDSDLNAQTITELRKIFLIAGKMLDSGIREGNNGLTKAANLVRRDVVFHIESLEREVDNS